MTSKPQEIYNKKIKHNIIRNTDLDRIGGTIYSMIISGGIFGLLIIYKIGIDIYYATKRVSTDNYERAVYKFRVNKKLYKLFLLFFICNIISLFISSKNYENSVMKVYNFGLNHWQRLAFIGVIILLYKYTFDVSDTKYKYIKDFLRKHNILFGLHVFLFIVMTFYSLYTLLAISLDIQNNIKFTEKGFLQSSEYILQKLESFF